MHRIDLKYLLRLLIGYTNDVIDYELRPVIMHLCKLPLLIVLTCTCVGIQPGRVEPASPIALTNDQGYRKHDMCHSSVQQVLQRIWRYELERNYR